MEVRIQSWLDDQQISVLNWVVFSPNCTSQWLKDDFPTDDVLWRCFFLPSFYPSCVIVTQHILWTSHADARVWSWRHCPFLCCTIVVLLLLWWVTLRTDGKKKNKCLIGNCHGNIHVSTTLSKNNWVWVHVCMCLCVKVQEFMIECMNEWLQW